MRKEINVLVKGIERLCEFYNLDILDIYIIEPYTDITLVNYKSKFTIKLSIIITTNTEELLYNIENKIREELNKC